MCHFLGRPGARFRVGVRPLRRRMLVGEALSRRERGIPLRRVGGGLPPALRIAQIVSCARQLRSHHQVLAELEVVNLTPEMRLFALAPNEQPIVSWNGSLNGVHINYATFVGADGKWYVHFPFAIDGL